MNRDMDLVRQILFQVEGNADPQDWMDPVVQGYPEEQVSYHIMVLHQAGLLEGTDRSAIGIFRWSARRLTWEGHEFAEAARSDEIWAKARGACESEGTLNFDVLKHVLLTLGKERAVAKASG